MKVSIPALLALAMNLANGLAAGILQPKAPSNAAILIGSLLHDSSGFGFNRLNLNNTVQSVSANSEILDEVQLSSDEAEKIRTLILSENERDSVSNILSREPASCPLVYCINSSRCPGSCPSGCMIVCTTPPFGGGPPQCIIGVCLP